MTDPDQSLADAAIDDALHDAVDLNIRIQGAHAFYVRALVAAIQDPTQKPLGQVLEAAAVLLSSRV